MRYKCYLKKNTVYIPTLAQLTTGAYTEVEPVAVVPIAKTEDLRRAFLNVIDRGNAIVPNPQDDKWPPPVLLKYVGAKSWSAFMRGTEMWGIKEDGDTGFKIIGYKIHPKGYWTEDRNQDIEFPVGSAAGDVVDRLIAILQNVARS